jgi:hypothetical protein
MTTLLLSALFIATALTLLAVVLSDDDRFVSS